MGNPGQPRIITAAADFPAVCALLTLGLTTPDLERLTSYAAANQLTLTEAAKLHLTAARPLPPPSLDPVRQADVQHVPARPLLVRRDSQENATQGDQPGLIPNSSNLLSSARAAFDIGRRALPTCPVETEPKGGTQ